MSTQLPQSHNSFGLENVTAIACMMKWFPSGVVESAIEAAGRGTIRLRRLPMLLVFYLCVMWGLNRKDSITEALEKLLAGTEFIFGKPVGAVPVRSGIVQARQKLGEEPVRTVFEQCARPRATNSTPGSYYRNWRLTALDGCILNVADSKANAAFGRPSNQSSTESAYPQMRMVCLGECGTHVIFEAELGGYNDGERALAKKVLPKLKPDMLCLMDRLFFGYALWKLADTTGAALVWRIKSDVKLHPTKLLADGSYLAKYLPSPRDEENKHGEPIILRVIEYERRTVRPREVEKVRLVTNILTPSAAPAEELALLYCQRWEIELIYGELKTRLNENQVCLRSNIPEMARQELWGLLLAHYLIRATIHEAAMSSKPILDPDDISFIGTVNVIRREMMISGDFSP